MGLAAHRALQGRGREPGLLQWEKSGLWGHHSPHPLLTHTPFCALGQVTEPATLNSSGLGAFMLPALSGEPAQG